MRYLFPSCQHCSCMSSFICSRQKARSRATMSRKCLKTFSQQPRRSVGDQWDHQKYLSTSRFLSKAQIHVKALSCLKSDFSDRPPKSNLYLNTQQAALRNISGKYRNCGVVVEGSLDRIAVQAAVNTKVIKIQMQRVIS